MDQSSLTDYAVVGFINETFPSVRQFLGVPFAQPPVDSLRFLPPVALNESLGTINATSYSPSCAQFRSSNPSVYTVDAPEFSISGPTSEDCLTLSVWTPLNSPANDTGLPVLVWIYGGGFQTGGTEVPYQIPSSWIERTQSHIVVSIQYRLNIFGFPNAVGLTDQNLGLLDQRLGLEWLRSNIAAFGGDPNRMVLWGQSAGAASVDYQNFAFPDDPIVSGLICDSGTVYLPSPSASSDTQQTNFTFVAKSLGCPATPGPDQLSCMRAIPSTTIESFLKAYSDNGTSPGIDFAPIPDERVVFSNYTARYAMGALASIPAIFGTNTHEGESLAGPYSPTGPPQSAADQVTLSTFLCPAAMTSMQRTLANRTTYRYQYDGNFTNISPRPYLGAYHSSELPLVFGTYDEYRGEGTAFEAATSLEMQDLWLAFAEDPGNAAAAGWVPYTSGLALELGSNGTVVQQRSVAGIDSPCQN
ncbi:MAG: hypothetical protein Q9227_002018 [Pyrenula ochraceoflavens]